ncbi:hypothetical protein MTBBW1_1350004 [Desulfamplus magnetovallimortis]|uniref:Uncharacterized protein n=1 Tax=Desulfamplus magnetovallimortis TaxID=1246637 RepID=A0A1W1H7I3_9BACT|nr:hypothetical protein MTBBW1_1350004 [Desulfamplus magnetovallimortis]
MMVFGDQLDMSQSPLIGAVFLTDNINTLPKLPRKVSIPSNRGSVSDTGIKAKYSGLVSVCLNPL